VDQKEDMAKFEAFDGQELKINNFYRDGHCFLLVNGPNLLDYDLDQLSRPGIMTLGVNNGPSVFRPDLYVMADDNSSFIRSIWLDPKITKFVPSGKKNKKLYHNDKREWMKTKVKDCPSMVYYERNYKFVPDEFLGADSINWGCKAHICACGYEAPSGKRPKDKTCPSCGEKRFGYYNIIYLAIGLCHALGFRHVYLLGADFSMSKDHTYAFDQKRHSGSIKNNNAQYIEANRRFDTLRPIFEKKGFHVYNCYKESGLKSFDYKPFDECIKAAAGALPPAVKDKWGVWRCDESTRDLYDRKHDEKQAKKRGGNGTTLDEFLKMKGVA